VNTCFRPLPHQRRPRGPLPWFPSPTQSMLQALSAFCRPGRSRRILLVFGWCSPVSCLTAWTLTDVLNLFPWRPLIPALHTSKFLLHSHNHIPLSGSCQALALGEGPPRAKSHKPLVFNAFRVLDPEFRIRPGQGALALEQGSGRALVTCSGGIEHFAVPTRKVVAPYLYYMMTYFSRASTIPR